MAEIGLDAAGVPEFENAPKPQRGFIRGIKVGAALVSQILGPAAFGFFLQAPHAPDAQNLALAVLAVALGGGVWAGGVRPDAHLLLRALAAISAVLGTSACLWLYVSRGLPDMRVATGLGAMALICANLAPALGLLASGHDADRPTETAAITPGKLVIPAATASAQIVALVAIFVFARMQLGVDAFAFFFAALVGVVAPLLFAIQRTGPEEGATSFSGSATQFSVLIAFTTVFACLAGMSAIGKSLLSHGPDAPNKLTLLLVACGLAVLVPVAFCWRQAVEDQRFPASRRNPRPFDHIDAWAVILFALAVAVIVLIALWAATSQATTDGINANWGVGTTALVAAMFVAFAFAPQIELPRNVTAGLAAASKSVTGLGRAISWLDGVFAIPIACASGANLERWWMRYLILALAIVPCGVLGYWLPEPYGLVAIAWGFVATIAISRRWAWVEDDREVAMLTRNFSSPSLRVGFKQDLRDEALLSFLSMFIFVPLALRQADMWAVAHHVKLFTLTGGAQNDLRTWVAFYGSELAKAVPFVDWAETYSVEGKTSVEFKDSIWAKHLVFLTRILVDLVFLGALLQAMAISARITRQREMFFGKDRDAAPYRHGNREKRKGDLDRLDPFIESREFRKLVAANGAADREKIASFPTYDSARLIALADDDNKVVALVARALREHQRTDDPARLSELHDALMDAVSVSGRIDKERVIELVNALKVEPSGHDIISLRAARSALNGKPWSTGVRRDIVTVIAKTRDSMWERERQEALIWCLIGDPGGAPADNPEGRIAEERDARAEVRDVALSALMAMPGDAAARAAIETCAQSDPAENLRRRARSFLDKTPPPPLPPPSA